MSFTPEQMRLWREKNKEDIAEKAKVYRLKNIDIITANKRAYYQKNKAKTSKACANYYQANKDKIHRKRRERINSDPNTKIATALRSRIRRAVTQEYRAGSAVRDLGCSVLFFKDFIAAKFLEGMSWDNYGEWHLDHIKPLSMFDLTNREEFLIACHYTNYQPLWAEDNIRKGNKFPHTM